MKIQIAKRSDGSGVLKCVRDDGTVTWQKQKTTVAPFFALHDLTHLAVESVLDVHNGFFGLIEQGWEIEDTTGKGARGPLPGEAALVERIVGMLDTERASGTLTSAEEFNLYARSALSDSQLAAIRQRRSALFAKWSETTPGPTFEAEWPGANSRAGVA